MAAVAVNTMALLTAATKEVYKASLEAALFLEERVLLGLVAKDESFGGRDTPVVNYVGRTGGESPDFDVAQAIAAARSKTQEDFQLTGVTDYSIIRIPGDTLAYVKNNTQAWDMLVSSLAQDAIDDAEDNLADSLEIALYRDGSGTLATVKAVSDETATTVVVEFVESDAAMLFELGDRITTAQTVTGAVESNSNFYVSAVNVPANQITVTEVTAGTDDVANISTTNKYVRKKGGEQTSAGSANAAMIQGLASWIPTSVSSDLHFNVDRTASSKYYGKYFDYSAKSRSQALLDASAQLAKEGGSPDTALVCYLDYRALLDELGLDKSFVDMNAVSERGLIANIGFRGVVAHGINGPINVMPAPRQISQEAALIRLSDWTLHSAGPALNLEDHDGLSVLRLSDADGYEGRMAFRGQLSCKRAGRQGRVKLASL